MADGDSEDLKQALADIDELRLELAKATNDWTIPVAVRSYDTGEDGQDDYEDEAMLFEEHGYDRTVVQEEAALTATYRRITGGPGSRATIEAAFCPRCGTPRVGGFQFCGACGLAFDTLGQNPAVSAGGGWPEPASTAGRPRGVEWSKETIAGAAWVVGALLIGYLAIEQLSAAATVARLQAFDQSLGVAYTGVSQSDLQLLALWNAAVAVLTGFAAFLLLRDPSDRDLRVSVTWALINVVGGVFEVANGVSAAAFLAATVVMAAAGIASFVALQERASQPAAPAG